MTCSNCNDKGYFEVEQQFINGELVDSPTQYHCTKCNNPCQLCTDDDSLCLAQDIGNSNKQDCPKCNGFGDHETATTGPSGNPIGGTQDCSYCNGTGKVSFSKWKSYHENL